MASSGSEISGPDVAASLFSEEGINFEETKKGSLCCGIPRTSSSKSVTTIPWQDILSATVLPPSDNKEHESIEIAFVRHDSADAHSKVRPTTKIILLPPSVDSTDSEKLVQSIVEKAYPNNQQRKRILVLVNPFSGKGKGSAEKKYNTCIEPIFRAALCEVKMTKTQYKSHAVELMQGLNIEEYDVVACCSGDGVPHEVFNGLAKRPDARRALAKLAVVGLPGGSGNGMCWNSFNTGTPSLAALRLVKSYRTPMDLVSITHPSFDDPKRIERTLSFLTQAVGVIADCDLGTEHLRFLGESRFALGLIWKIVTKTLYPCDIALEIEMEDKEQIREFAQTQSALPPDYLDPQPRFDKELDGEGMPQLRYGTVADPLPEGWTLQPHDTIGNFYCGNVINVQGDGPFFPLALPADGLMDLVMIRGDIPTGPALKMMDECPKNKLFDNPSVKYRKVRGYRLIPRNKSGHISIDGEPIPHAPFQAEVHQRLGTTLTMTGRVYEGPGIPAKPASAGTSTS